jgi:hypothetical protein
MKAKTLLIAAAAALTAGIISAQAQTYSQNIVGYANVSTPNGGQYLMSVPFKIGSSNGANEIWPLVSGNPSIPDGSTLEVWDSGSSTFTTYLSDSGSSSLWDDNGGNPIPNAPVLPVGQGFFLIPAGDTTNTFAGAISVSVNSSNSASLPNGGQYLVGCVVPYAGSITNGNPTTGAGGAGLSALNGLPDGSTLEIWNAGTSTYTTYLSDSGSPSFWDDNGGNPIPVAPTISVGQGFFVIPSDNFTWKVGL